MNPNSKFHPKYRSSTGSTSLMNVEEMEPDFERVVSGLSDTTAASTVAPITTKQLITQTVSGEDAYDVITASPSGSSDGSSNEFVKVEHSDLQQSAELVTEPLSFRMLQMHNDSDDEKRRTDRKYPVENIMDHKFGSEELYSGILPRAAEFAESAVEKVGDLAKSGAEKVMDATNKAVDDAKVTGEALGDTLHLFGNKLKETVGQAEDMGHQAVETAKDTASNMLSGMAQDISNTSQKIRGMGADMAHSLHEDANKAMHAFKGEFDDVTHDILDTNHHAFDTLKNTLQEAEVSGDALKDKNVSGNTSHSNDSYAKAEASGATKPRHENLIQLADEINNGLEHDAGHRTVFHQPTDGDQQDVDYPSQQRGLNWRQHSNEGAGIDAPHFGFDVKPAAHSAENAIHDEIVDVHDQVDSMITKMFAANAPQHDDNSAEESMFDRKGPLTIPHQTPKDTKQFDQFDHGFNSSKQSGFDVSPRPPTPPKEYDDEDVKPTTIDLGRTAVASSGHPSSILKNNAQGVRFNFKNWDARCKLPLLPPRNFITYWI